jgi:hypothetical protein
LVKVSISKNTGQRTGETKIKLDVWKNQNKTQKTLVTSVKELYELLTSAGTEVTNLIFPNDDVVWVSWKHSQDNNRREKR